MPLPPSPTPAAYGKLYRTPARVLPAAAAIAARHLPAGLPIAWMPGGVNMLFSAGDDHVIKLFAPFYADDYARERGSMAASAALDVPTPAVVAQGELEGWPYMVLTRVPGRTVQSVWKEVPHRDRRVVAEQLGAAVAELQRTPPPDDLRVNWPKIFRNSQVLNAPGTQGRRGACGLDRRIPGFLDRHAPPLDTELRLIHADLHGRNVLLQRVRGRWRLGGVLDFGDAFVGPREYDFVAPGLWILGGEPGLFATFLDAYGYGPRPDFPERMLAMSLVHRFGWLKGMRRLAKPSNPRTLDALARAIFMS